MARKSTETTTGWYPHADPIGIPDTNYAVGNDGPLAVVLHIVGGSFLSCISEFTAPKRKSSHFLIGKNDAVKQFVSVHDTAFANGLSWSTSRQCWIDPDGNALIAPHKPPWSLLRPPRNPNYYTVSIEREGKPADVPTQAMDDATVALLLWLGSQFPALRPYKALVNLIGHRHIGPIHRANCPGPHVDFAALAQAANATLPPAGAGFYTARAPGWISETPGPRGPIALAGKAIFDAGEVVDIDEVRADGWAHTRNGVGFIPIGGLEKV